MPRKVVTRRQRKAAEAKRQNEIMARLNANDGTNNASDMNLENSLPHLDLQPSCSSVKTAAAAVKPAKKNVESNRKEISPSPQQFAKVDKKAAPAKVKVPINKGNDEKKAQSDKTAIESLISEYNNNNTGGTMPPPPPPLSEQQQQQNSFSKTLTRRAAATFTKIQKLSKVFNKKLNLRQPSAAKSVGGEPMNLNEAELDETVNAALNGNANANANAGPQNRTCSCEFCKVVLNQLLVGKKRMPDKKHCKNSGRRLPNRRRSTSPGRSNLAPNFQQQQCEECKLQASKAMATSAATNRHVAQILEKKDKFFNREVMRKVKQLRQRAKEIKLEQQKLQNEGKQERVVKYEVKSAGTHANAGGCPTANVPNQTISRNRKDACTTTSPVELIKATPSQQCEVKKDNVKGEIKPVQIQPQASYQARNAANNKPRPRRMFNKETYGFDKDTTVQPPKKSPMQIIKGPTSLKKSDLQQLPKLKDAAPMRFIGNSGYFTLTGTDIELTAQLMHLEAKNVRIQLCLQVKMDPNEIIEKQLEQLDKNREQIIQSMYQKHEMMAPRRQKRNKEPSKYN